MDRQTALALYGMYKIQKEYNRNVYPDELRTHNVCASSMIPGLLLSLMDSYSIEEEIIQGANTYRITNIGMAHLESYLDIKRELDKAG